MPKLAVASREARELKPAHGAACNSCGLCCEMIVCPFGSRVLGIPEEPGRCPALMGEPGKAACGLVKHPEQWMPVRTYAVGREAMSNAARLLINAGDGCDCRINGEPRNEAFYEHLHRLDVARAKAILRAKKLWQLTEK